MYHMIDPDLSYAHRILPLSLDNSDFIQTHYLCAEELWWNSTAVTFRNMGGLGEKEDIQKGPKWCYVGTNTWWQMCAMGQEAIST